jgi:hypothetical protein
MTANCQLPTAYCFSPRAPLMIKKTENKKSKKSAAKKCSNSPTVLQKQFSLPYIIYNIMIINNIYNSRKQLPQLLEHFFFCRTLLEHPFFCWNIPFQVFLQTIKKFKLIFNTLKFCWTLVPTFQQPACRNRKQQYVY